MRSSRVISTIETHTAGMPTRVVTSGLGQLPGRTMQEKRLRLVEQADEIRTLLMYEPRGHSAMSGAILQTPTTSEADLGVLFIEVSGALPMCGHGTIGVVTAAIECGLVDVTEPVTVVRLDTPAGVITARATVADGRCVAVALENVPSFVLAADQEVEVEGLGTVAYDLAYGGNFYAIVEADSSGLPLGKTALAHYLDAGVAVMHAIGRTGGPTHPTDPAITGLKHVQFVTYDEASRTSRNVTVIHPRWLDRSPCGTGTSARMAQLHARGLLEVHQTMISESPLGTQFTGRLLETTEVGGVPAVVPRISGTAYVTGTANWFLDELDPFPAGFLLDV